MRVESISAPSAAGGNKDGEAAWAGGIVDGTTTGAMTGGGELGAICAGGGEEGGGGGTEGVRKIGDGAGPVLVAVTGVTPGGKVMKPERSMTGVAGCSAGSLTPHSPQNAAPGRTG